MTSSVSRTAAVVIAAAWITGCATTDPQPVQCQAPPMPNPPEMSPEELAPLSDAAYWKLRRRDDAWQGAVLERQRMLESICGD